MRYLVAIVCLLAPSLAFAHAEEPNAQSVFAMPEDGWVVRANFGVVDSQVPDRFVCEEAFLGGDGWILGALGPTEWITFGESSVRRTEDGCDFEKIAEVPVRPSDATVHVASGNAAYLMNGDAAAGLWVSTDRGRSFELVDGLAPELHQFTGVRFLDEDTLLVSAYARQESGASRLFRVDLGGPPEELAVPADTTFPYILAAGGGQMVLLARRTAQVVFWASPDEMASADELELGGWPTGALLSADGNTAWISGTEGSRGIMVGRRESGNVLWTPIIDGQAANCIGGDEDSMFVCGLGRLDGADVFAVRDEMTEQVLNFRTLRGPRSCPQGTEVADVCPLVWREIASYFGADPNADLGGFPEPDAGADDVGVAPDVAAPGSDAGAGADGPSRGCCATWSSARPARSFPTGSVGLAGLLALAAATRARRRRRSAVPPT